MKIKNINPLERHVEKCTLAVAAAAAFYLGYTSLTTPITVDSGNRHIPAAEVEDVVTRAAQQLARDMESREKTPLRIAKTDYVASYHDQQKDPFPPHLLAAVPPFVPINVSATEGPGIETRHTEPIVTPIVPPPDGVHAAAAHGLIIPAKPALAAAPGTAAPVATGPAPIDANWVKIDANYPMLDLRAKFANVGGKPEESLPEAAQRITFYRVEVQRKEKLPTGEWSKDWEDVPPIKIAPPPEVDLAGMDSTNIQHALDTLDAYVLTILMPPFYTILRTTQEPAVSASATTRPAPKGTPPTSLDMRIIDEIKRQKEAANRINGGRLPSSGARTGPPSSSGGGPPFVIGPIPSGGGPPTGVPLPGVPNGGPPAGVSYGGGPPTYGGGPPTGGPMTGPPTWVTDAPPSGGPPGTPAGAIQNAQGLQKENSIGIWFYDENVLPDHDYMYRMRVDVYNPTFHFPLTLKDPSFLNQPWLKSVWVQVPDPVHIEATQQFFLTSGIGPGAGSISVKIYQWHQGKIAADEETITPGMMVGAVKTLDHSTVDFRTGYTVVDVQERNHDSSVVLLSPTGQLVTRDLQTDSKNPKRLELEDKYRRALPAPGAATPTGP